MFDFLNIFWIECVVNRFSVKYMWRKLYVHIGPDIGIVCAHCARRHSQRKCCNCVGDSVSIPHAEFESTAIICIGLCDSQYHHLSVQREPATSICHVELRCWPLEVWLHVISIFSINAAQYEWVRIIRSNFVASFISAVVNPHVTHKFIEFTTAPYRACGLCGLSPLCHFFSLLWNFFEPKRNDTLNNLSKSLWSW